MLQLTADHGIHHVSGRFAHLPAVSSLGVCATHPHRSPDSFVEAPEPPCDPSARPLFSPARFFLAQRLGIRVPARVPAARSPALASLPDPLPRERACVTSPPSASRLSMCLAPPASTRSLLPRLPRPPPEQCHLQEEVVAAAASPVPLTVRKRMASRGDSTAAASARTHHIEELGVGVEGTCRVRVPRTPGAGPGPPGGVPDQRV
jgi:hypothetical protein